MRVYPAPGAYTNDDLPVTIEAPSDEYALWFALNDEPELDEHKYYGSIRVRLKRSSQIVVMVADPRGKVWGPFAYAFQLRKTMASARCQVEIDRSLVNGTQSVNVAVTYWRATEIDELYLAQENVEREIALDELDDEGRIRFEAGPWPASGTHAFSCRVHGPQSFVAQSEVSVDATPPSATWLSGPGTYGRAEWPVSLRLWAADEFSGLADVRFCAAARCIAPMGIGGGLFQHATAFTAGTSFQAAISAVIRDQVGNETVLAPVAFGIEFAEPAGAPLGAITATTAATVSLFDRAALAGASIDELHRLGDFATNLSPDMIPLQPGWNDLLFRRAGKTDWESFAIYRLGVHATLPSGADPWLAFASNSTVPALNGSRLGSIAGGEFVADWWSVPHLWFVRDDDVDGRWSQSDAVCAPADDLFSGPWARQAEPYVWQVQAGDCVTPDALAPGDAVQVTCADCASAGSLFMEARDGWRAYPFFHGTTGPVSATALQAGLAVTFPAPAGALCLFYWDENENAIVDGGEPRDFESCGTATIDLLRRNGDLRASVAGADITIDGMAYGGAAWPRLTVMAGADVIVQRALGRASERDGTGRAMLAIPEDVARVWAWSLAVSDAASSALPVELPADSTAGLPEQLWVRVLNDYGLPFTAAAAVLLNAADELAGGIYAGAGAWLPVAVASQTLSWSATAYREGYVSKTAPIEGTAATLMLLSSQAAGVLAGQVHDALGRPAAFANVSWSAPPYSSHAVADAEGRFSLPALGLGSLWAEDTGVGQSSSLFFHMEPDSDVSGITLRIQGPGAMPGRGLVGEADFLWIKGAEYVETFASLPYYYAAVTAGVWTHAVGAMERRFVFPGYLPSYASLPAILVPMPPSAGSELTQYAACGDRRQPVGMGGTMQIDAPCWRWFAETSLDTYFLGFIEQDFAVDATERFGRLRIDVVDGVGDVLLLTDRLFDRTLRLPLAGGASGMIAAGTVAAGVYDVRGADGTPLVDGAGGQASVVVDAGVSSAYVLFYP